MTDYSIDTERFNELEVLQRCFSAVSDLMIPERDLHAVNRDDLGALLGYLANRMDKVMEGKA